MSSLAIPTSLAKTNEASLSVWCHSWWCVLHWEAHEAPLLISMLSWWTWQEIICAFCTQTTLWQPGFASTASKITRENNNNVKWPLLARESSEVCFTRPHFSLINTSQLGSGRLRLGPLTTGFSSAGILGTEACWVYFCQGKNEHFLRGRVTLTLWEPPQFMQLDKN